MNDWKEDIKNDPEFAKFLNENLKHFKNNFSSIMEKEDVYYRELTDKINEMFNELNLPLPIMTWFANRVLAKTVAGFLVSVTKQNVQASAEFAKVFQTALIHYIAVACVADVDRSNTLDSEHPELAEKIRKDLENMIRNMKKGGQT